ncbi:hypothetical protein FHS43_002208 [Streptosporangium becharense]|uniref:Uncharacterized protein n=1 Tax=Streptosporangium becharense TaxID=1816182 RepID=A0A7W9MIY2_9ACTN|nr:DUF6084 family protein [Streptosporangium becharense]MBB2910943.1 hypothetical protein [Streptosporangium becharense]MBB5821998.1 hypothetical protein [Streptosporangium becharense]
MDDLTFDCVGARAEPYAAFPTLVFRVRVTHPSPAGVHAIALRCQIRVEPHLRRYDAAEAEMLGDLFGDPARWGDTLKPLQFANVSVMVPAFTGTTEIDVPVPCGYDLEVAAGKYFAALDDGEIPMILLFGGTVFARTPGSTGSTGSSGGTGGFSVGQVPWHCEARHRLPVAVWRELMDRYFPDSGWLRLRRDTLRDLTRFKSDHALATWDETMHLLLRETRG